MQLCLMVWGCLCLVGYARGHGRLSEPTGRGRLGGNIDYNDNGLNCGGFSYQQSQGGKCGPCGDPWVNATEPPRAHENNGTFGQGIIAKNYTSGQTVDIKVQITAHHLGWFEFRICPLINPTDRATKQCLDGNLLTLAAGGSRYTLPNTGAGYYTVPVVLPAGLACAQCVLQWKYHAGNNWGEDENGIGAIGNGPQEEFYGCSDIRIQSQSGTSTTGATTSSASTTSTTTSTTTTTPAPATTPTTAGCLAIGAWTGDVAMDAWCITNCNHDPPYCPETHCSSGCRV